MLNRTKLHRIVPLVIAALMLCLPFVPIAQNAPVTTAETITGAVPGTIQVPVTVNGFQNIGAISLTIDYDYSVLQFMNGVPHSQLMPFSASDADLGNGLHRITMGWFGSGKTLPDASVIMTLNFTFVAGSTVLTWFDDGSSCEYADGSYNVLNDTPTSTYYINGLVCGILSVPGPINGDSLVCEGQSGNYYSIDPVTGATGYTWTVPQGAVITGGGNSTWIFADFPVGASSGDITVSAINLCMTGPSSQLPVTVFPSPNADAGPDTTILYGTTATLHAASGGMGLFSYHWSPEALLIDPDVQHPLTVPLVTTNIFTVFVTNQVTLCQGTDEVIVNISGGPLTVNPVAVPDSICKGSASQLFANAGGGSGNYTYLWTCTPSGSPPWTANIANPPVTPDTTTNYLLTLNDGYNSTSGSVSVTVTTVPGTPEIAFEDDLLVSDTCCGNQWYRNGLPIPGADGEAYLPEDEGLYFDIVTIGTCNSDTSNAIYVYATGVQQFSTQEEVLLFPNPAKDHLYVAIKNSNGEDFKGTLFDLSGQSVASFRMKSMISSEPYKLDLSLHKPGIYALILQSHHCTMIRKILVIP